MVKIIIWFIIICILFRALIRFVFPVAQITSATNDRLKKMQEQINEMNRKAAQAQEKEHKKPIKKQGDYIDYEELKP